MQYQFIWPFPGLELIPDRIRAISWHGDSFTKCWPPDGCSRDLDGGETFSISRSEVTHRPMAAEINRCRLPYYNTYQQAGPGCVPVTAAWTEIGACHGWVTPCRRAPAGISCWPPSASPAPSSSWIGTSWRGWPLWPPPPPPPRWVPSETQKQNMLKR